MLRSFSTGLIVFSISIIPPPLRAEDNFEFSLYSGYQFAPKSSVSIDGQSSFDAVWEGKSFKSPIYYGIRGVWWLGEPMKKNLGISVDFSHAKAYASEETLDKAELSRLEFSDGLNLLTINALYRFKNPKSKWAPYAGIGAGINIPHVELTRRSGKTFEYQIGGPTLQAQLGIAYKATKSISVFAEYKANYSFIDVSVDSGKNLNTNIFTNAFNTGLSYSF